MVKNITGVEKINFEITRIKNYRKNYTFKAQLLIKK
jgi:hypothetical protein